MDPPSNLQTLQALAQNNAQFRDLLEREGLRVEDCVGMTSDMSPEASQRDMARLVEINRETVTQLENKGIPVGSVLESVCGLPLEVQLTELTEKLGSEDEAWRLLGAVVQGVQVIQETAVVSGLMEVRGG